MFCNKFCIKMLGLSILSLFSGVAMPMAPRIPTPQYIPTAAQLGLVQQATATVTPELPRVKISTETMRRAQEELMKSEQQPAQQQKWTTQKMSATYAPLLMSQQSVQQQLLTAENIRQANDYSHMLQPEKKSSQKRDLSQRFTGTGSSSGMFRTTAPRLMSRKEAHRVLGITEQASPADTKAAYRKLAKKYHPDVAGTTSTAKMQELQNAYEIASNKQQATVESQTSSSSRASYSSDSQRSYQDDHNYSASEKWREYEKAMKQQKKQDRMERKRREREERSRETLEEKKARERKEQQAREGESEKDKQSREYWEAYYRREDDIPYGDKLNALMRHTDLVISHIADIKMIFQKMKQENASLAQEDLDDLLNYFIQANFTPSPINTSANPYEIVYFLLKEGARLKPKSYKEVEHLLNYISAGDRTEPIYTKKVFNYLSKNSSELKNIWKNSDPSHIALLLKYNGITDDLTPDEIKFLLLTFKTKLNEAIESIRYAKADTRRSERDREYYLKLYGREKDTYETAIKVLEKWQTEHNSKHEPQTEHDSKNEPTTEHYLKAALRRSYESIFGK
ncbi:MAG: DnaJ domain-containing protein [Candidatus Dependentiae bacterium]|nr:DnaJ domain-containing protein [Candidatus Dependentiae bacterium]